MSQLAPGARAELVVAEIDGEAVAWDPVAEHLHFLNHSAALVLGLCDGETNVGDMASAIAEAYEMDSYELEGQIQTIVDELGDAGMLEGEAAEQLARDAGERKAVLAGLRRIPVPQDT